MDINKFVDNAFYEITFKQVVNQKISTVQGLFAQTGKGTNFIFKKTAEFEDLFKPVFMTELKSLETCENGDIVHICINYEWSGAWDGVLSAIMSKNYSIRSQKYAQHPLSIEFVDAKPLRDTAGDDMVAQDKLSATDKRVLRDCAGIEDKNAKATQMNNLAALFSNFTTTANNSTTKNGSNANSSQLDKQKIAIAAHIVRIGAARYKANKSPLPLNYYDSLQFLDTIGQVAPQLKTALIASGIWIQGAAGGAGNKRLILGRQRVVRKEGRKLVITYKGNTISLSDAKKLEKSLKNKK
jgi:hypothetical protein